MSEALNIPVNVHRWRKLEIEDPQRYALMCKVCPSNNMMCVCVCVLALVI